MFGGVVAEDITFPTFQTDLEGDLINPSPYSSAPIPEPFFDPILNEWKDHELARQIHHEAKMSHPALPFCFWVDVPQVSPPNQEHWTSPIGTTITGTNAAPTKSPSKSQAVYPPEARMTVLADEFALAAAPSQLPPPGTQGQGKFTLLPRANSWLVTRGPTNGNSTTYQCFPCPESSAPYKAWDSATYVTGPVREVLGEVQSRLPGYLGISLELARRPVISSNRLMTIQWSSGGKGGGGGYHKGIPDTPPEINLIDNAIKHSPEHGSITVALNDPFPTSQPNATSTPAQAEHPEKHIQLIVSDQGPGIPKEDRERIFERFYRRGSELQRQTQGVGIGLHIVKKIVDAHGGRIWVEDGTGRGSRFIMELPFLRKP